VIWSITSFVFEVPSGAWADVVDRRLLLGLSAALLAAAFTCWTLAPGYAGFAVGFALWGLSGAIESGTFESLLYDELARRGAAGRYARIDGWANATSMVAVVVAVPAGGLLMETGGFRTVGAVSIGVVAVHGLLVRTLPDPRRAVTDQDGDEDGDLEDDGAGLGARYVARLREGLREAGRHAAVRGATIVSALVIGLSAYDEYVPLVAAEHGAGTTAAPLVLAAVVAGQVVGTALAGRTSAMAPRTVGVVVALAALAQSVGAWRGGGLGFALLAGGYGMLSNAMVVSEARLQAVISGPARATVTSTAGLATEVVSLAVYGGFALGSRAWSMTTLVVLLGLPTLGAAMVAARLLPAGPGRAQTVTESPSAAAKTSTPIALPHTRASSASRSSSSSSRSGS